MHEGRWKRSTVCDACLPLNGAPIFIVTTLSTSSSSERLQDTRFDSSSLMTKGGRKGDEKLFDVDVAAPCVLVWG